MEQPCNKHIFKATWQKDYFKIVPILVVSFSGVLGVLLWFYSFRGSCIGVFGYCCGLDHFMVHVLAFLVCCCVLVQSPDAGFLMFWCVIVFCL